MAKTRSRPRRASRKIGKTAYARTITSRREPNLLISIDERNRDRAALEVRRLLARAGEHRPLPARSPGPALLGVWVHGDPRTCAERLREILSQDPVAFQHTHRWIPIESWTKADAAHLATFAHHCNAEIGPASTWRIELERHGTRLSRKSLVDSLAKGIDNPNVDLDHGEKTVVLEVFGTRAGLAVLDDRQRLSVDRTLRDEFVRFEERE